MMPAIEPSSVSRDTTSVAPPRILAKIRSGMNIGAPINSTVKSTTPPGMPSQEWRDLGSALIELLQVRRIYLALVIDER